MNDIQLVGGQAIIQMGRQERQNVAATVVSQALEGNVDALEVLQSIRSWEEIFKEVKGDPRFDTLAKEEIAKHGKAAHLNGHTITTSEAGVEFDFSVCNDPVLDRLEAQFKKAEAELKERKEFLKKVPAKGIESLDSETGEVTIIYPPARSSKTVIKITLKK